MNLTVTNRDLLRNYKELKGKLLNGDIDQVLIPQDDGMVIKVSVERVLTPVQQLIAMIKKKPILNVKRPEQDIF